MQCRYMMCKVRLDVVTKDFNVKPTAFGVWHMKKMFMFIYYLIHKNCKNMNIVSFTTGLGVVASYSTCSC